MQQYDIIKEQYQPKVDELLSKCVECGDCLYNCNFQYWGINRAEAIKVIKALNSFLRGETIDKNAKHKILLCALSGECSKHCKLGLDRKAANLVCKSMLTPPRRVTKSVPSRLSTFRKKLRTLKRRVFKYSRQDKKWWRSHLKLTKKGPEVLIYYGCWGQRNPEWGRKFEAILEKLNITFDTLGGYVNCCGGFALNRGMPKDFNHLSAQLATKIDTSKPKVVTTFCGHCFESLQYINEVYLENKFNIKHPLAYMEQFAETAKIKKDDKLYTTSAPCLFGHFRQQQDSPSLILNKIGEHVPLQKNSLHPLCCGSVSAPYSNELLQKQNRKRHYILQKKDIEQINTICPICQEVYSQDKNLRKEYNTTMLIDLLAEKTGIKLKDKKIKKPLKEQWKLFYGMMGYGILLSLAVPIFIISNQKESMTKNWIIILISLLSGITISFIFYMFTKVTFRNFFKQFYASTEKFLEKELPPLPPMKESAEIDQINSTFRDISQILKSDIEKLTHEEKAKAEVESAFGKYVDPRIVEQLLAKQTGDGTEKELYILVADLRGFTSFSEQLTPRQVVEFLNRYFEEMTEVITKNGGIIDRIVGDEIRAAFGVFQQIDRAQHKTILQAGQQMLHRFKKLKTELKEKNYPNIGLGIGISYGKTIMGNIGSAEKINYTFLGKSVFEAGKNCDIAKDGKIVVPEWMTNG